MWFLYNQGVNNNSSVVFVSGLKPFVSVVFITTALSVVLTQANKNEAVVMGFQ